MFSFLPLPRYRDLALEAEILSVLNHPHVIKLRGITSAGPNGFLNGHSGFFLIIDRVSVILCAYDMHTFNF